MLKSSTLALAAALCAAIPVHAQVHKWVDANGKVQYSDQPPPGQAGVQKLRIEKSVAVPPAPAAKAPKTLAERDLEFRQNQVAAEEAKKKQQQADADAKLRQGNCINAKGNLKTLEEGGRVFNYDSKGEKQYLDDSGREKAIADARRQVSEWCK